MEYGGNRRAMLAVNGESVTVRKGDRVGIWSVVSIGEKTVQLSSAAGNLHRLVRRAQEKHHAARLQLAAVPQHPSVSLFLSMRKTECRR